MNGGSDAANGQNGGPGTRGRQDAGHFIERFAALTGVRVRSMSVESLPRAFLSQPVPAPDRLVTEYGDELKPRTCNALCLLEPGTEGEPSTMRRLLQLPGFGLLSLLDLLEVLARHEISMRMPDDPAALARPGHAPVASGLDRRGLL